MWGKRRNVTPFSLDYRRPPRWGMGLPPRRPRRWWHRLADPQFYLRAVIFLSIFALLVIPLLADGTLALARPIAAGAGTCRVLHVVDGDTADFWCSDTGIERVRFVGFDAPELFSPKCVSELVAAQKAKWALRAHLIGTTDLRMERGKLDRYERRLIRLWLKDRSLSQMMIAGGNARAYGGGSRGSWCV
jgi:micrococcal nuclease